MCTRLHNSFPLNCVFHYYNFGLTSRWNINTHNKSICLLPQSSRAVFHSKWGVLSLLCYSELWEVCVCVRTCYHRCVCTLNRFVPYKCVCVCSRGLCVVWCVTTGVCACTLKKVCTSQVCVYLMWGVCVCFTRGLCVVRCVSTGLCLIWSK